MIDIVLTFLLGIVLASSIMESLTTGKVVLFSKNWARDTKPRQFWTLVLLEAFVLIALVFVTLRDLIG